MNWINGACSTPSYGYRLGPNGRLDRDDEADKPPQPDTEPDSTDTEDGAR
ncbi:hypothetical protein [Saccharomonospora sp.]|nr:hypothetical protein [Saccharomonospora sp.]